MKFNLPTLKEVENICKNTDAFYIKDTIVEGQNVKLVDYRLASISDFVDNNAFELRGLCFVELDNGEWKRHILMNKFFNVGQTIGWMYEDVKDKKITRIQNKEDGSIISFVKFGGIGGSIRAKSKMSFISEQAVMAQEIYDNNKKVRSLIETLWYDDYTPIFELVGPENQIVLEYQNTELILLQIRDKDGNYGSKELMKSYLDIWDLKGANEFSSFHTLDMLIEQKEINQEPIEGWVITFEDGQMAKIKTNKYLSLHGLIGPDAFRENLLIKTILDGNIDDVISALVPGQKKDKIVVMDEKVTHKFNYLVRELFSLDAEYYNFHKENRKSFALVYSPKGTNPHELFGAYMKNCRNELTEKVATNAVKLHIESHCNSLGKAKEWIEGL